MEAPRHATIASFQVKAMPMHTSTLLRSVFVTYYRRLVHLENFESERVEIYNFADATDD
jgi:hypothetical protein